MEYPRYISHKTVSAVKIAAVDNGADGSVTLHLEGGFDNVVISHHNKKHKPEPEVGGYLVLYADGYFSFSPARPFEEGYTLVEDTPLVEDTRAKELAQMLVEYPGAAAVAAVEEARISGSPLHLVAAKLAAGDQGTTAIEDDDEDEDDPEVADAINNHGQGAVQEQAIAD
jgi:hypothetical protein